jgi:hypothetical protein
MAQKDVTVTVNPGVGITVSPTTPITLKKNQDTIQWKSQGDRQEFGIVLPHGEPAVQCGWQGSKWVCTAGPFDNTSNKNRPIKYDVTAPGTPTLDPDIEILP